jgi:glycosyltransferase involved in cell wall biosynthesis
MKVLLFANTEWYLYNFRLGLAKFLRSKGLEVVMMSPPGPYGARLEAAGFRWIPVDMNRRSLNPWRELRLMAQIARILRREAPLLVHNFTIKCVVYGALAARWAGVAARINAVAGMGHIFSGKGFQVLLLRPIVKALLGLALSGKTARLIVQNLDDQAALTDSGLIAKEFVRLIGGSGVDTSRFQPQATTRPSGPMRVLLAARLLWDKGIGEYVEAARQLKHEGLNVEFLLAGDIDPGNPASVSAGDVDAWRVEGIVRPLGHVEDMVALLSEIDVMALPSSYGEGVPRSLIEAAACGLPIVTTDAPGCREIVEDGVNGLLVPVRDANALAQAIKRLHADPALRQTMGQAGREKVLREFDEQIVFEKTLAVYRELLEVC